MEKQEGYMNQNMVEREVSYTLPSITEILTLPIEALLERLGSSLSGLSSEEARRRLDVLVITKLSRGGGLL